MRKTAKTIVNLASSLPEADLNFEERETKE